MKRYSLVVSVDAMHYYMSALEKKALAIAEPFVAASLLTPYHAVRIVHSTIGACMCWQGTIILV